MLGEKKEHEDYILKTLPSNIDTKFVYKESSPTITKKRFVDHITKNKSLGVYSMNDSLLNEKAQSHLLGILNQLIPDYDLMIVSDYGHGFISKEVAEYISNQSIFVSLNAQINAANIGYHTMNKYKNIDCTIINETELRHELRDRESNIEDLMILLAKSLQSNYLVVTQGSKGATLYLRDNNSFFRCPAFASKVVDKIGSGDAMLALLSCSLKMDFDLGLALFLGSLAAAQSVETIGNSVPVQKTNLLKMFKHIIK